MDLPLSEAVIRLVLAILLGSIVGMEREYTQQSAGLRTHILVCMGATVFTIVSASSNMTAQPGHHIGDSTRIAAQIVSGIGFIGAGAVMQRGASIRGLTTAASLWMMASIGMLVGAGYYQISIIATMSSFMVLFIIGWLERSMFKKYLKKYTQLRIQVIAQEKKADEIGLWVDRMFPNKIVEVKSHRNENDPLSTITYLIDLRGLQVDMNALSTCINAIEGVSSSSIRIAQEEKL